MKSVIKVVISVIVLAAVGGVGYIKLRRATPTPEQTLFKTQRPTKQTIKQVISVSGSLEIKDTMVISSIKEGTISDVRVKLNEQVKKGQILAIVQTIVGETEYREALHDYENARREHEYQKAYFARQESLYKAGQLAQNTYENIRKVYQQSFDTYKKSKATLDKKKMDYHFTYIKAPTAGTVISVDATKGKVVTTYTANTSLFQIARDVHDMRANLEIDESDIGLLKQGQAVTLIPNSFPERKIRTTINEISYVPMVKPEGDKDTTFKAIADVNNADGALRPGMIVNATIKVNEAIETLCITGLAFHLNRDALKAVAKKCSLQYVPLTKAAIKAFKTLHKHDICRVVWVVQGKQFVQKIIRLGVTDDTNWQIISGLTEQDNVITDIEEANELEEMLKKQSATF